MAYPKPLFKARILGILAVLFISTACSGGPTAPAMGTKPSAPLTSFPLPTPSRTVAPAGGTVRPTPVKPTIPPPPTATPVLYKIQKGDTMLGIALFHGLTLEELQAANPDVDPNLMKVGTDLVIPVRLEGTATAIPTPTALPLEIGDPACYPAADGGVWCLVQVHNVTGKAVESVSAWMTPYQPGSPALAGQEANLPLNLLPAGESLPLAAYFEVAGIGYNANVELLTALPVDPESRRYLQVTVQVQRVEVTPGGKAAAVEGRVEFPARMVQITPPASPDPGLPATASGSPAATATAATAEPQRVNWLWLAAVAYDAGGQPVGIRKWEAQPGLLPGDGLDFQISVYSLGPKIERVEVLAEARP